MEERNQRPKEGSSLPTILLIVLLSIIVALLYVGWEYLTDKPTSSEFTNVKIDSTSILDDPEDSVEKDMPPVQVITQASTTNSVTKDEPKPTTTTTPTTSVVKKEEPKPAPTVAGEDYYHTMAAGQTFYGIANRYNLKFSTLQALNPQIKDPDKDTKSGITKIKVKIQAIHTVGPGDVLRVVAAKYGISKEMLMKANGRTKDMASRGEKLIIPIAKKE